MVDSIRKSGFNLRPEPIKTTQTATAEKLGKASAKEKFKSPQKTTVNKLLRTRLIDDMSDQEILHAFVEIFLAHEFGDKFVLDPYFPSLVKKVKHSFETDPELVRSVVLLAKQTKN